MFQGASQVTQWVKNPPACMRLRRHTFDLLFGKIPWRRKWNSLQYSCLENPMDTGARRATVHRVAKKEI